MESQMKSSVQIGTAGNFDALVLSGAAPIVVDFWAPWCVWCKKLAPYYEELAGKHASRLKFVKVNVEEEPELSQRFGITSLPTLKFFCSGREIGEQIGAPPKDRLDAILQEIVRTHKECLATSSPARA